MLRGGQDNDLIAGDAGDDILMGDLGNDTLRAGAGLDRLVGGGGADLFEFSAAGAASLDGSGQYTAILDFVDGSDLIRLGFAVTAGDVLTQSGSFNSVGAAKSAAEALMALHDGTRDAVVLQVGVDSYLFYNAAGTADTVNAIVGLSGISATAITISDFG